MAYNRHTWVAPQGTNRNRFNKSNETATSVVLVQNPTITNNPTPFSVEWMNEMEAGIFEAHERIDSRYGEVHALMFQPSVPELAQMRCLPLEGQVITISTYQRLCNRMYVGDAKNATADAWYKISDPNNKNSRSTSVAYMVVADMRGIFLKAAALQRLAKYLISETELRSIEQYKMTSEREKRNWLLQVQGLKTESANLNVQLARGLGRCRAGLLFALLTAAAVLYLPPARVYVVYAGFLLSETSKPYKVMFAIHAFTVQLPCSYYSVISP